MTTIITKNSSTASAVPASGDLVQGELAVNVTDKKIFTKNAAGTIVTLVDLDTAAASASAAATSATNAATSASAASTSASNASTSATNAATAQSAAEAARDATLAAYDSFDDRYLGAKTSDPSVDNDGNALVAGSLYYNSVSEIVKLYTGSAWVAAYVSGSGYVATSDIGVTVQAYDADLTTWAGKTAPSGTVVGTTDTQTLSAKTIEAGTFTNGYTEETATANTSTAYTIDLANGTVQVLTLTGNCTFTFPTVAAGKSFIMLLKQDGTGSRTVTWPATVKWPGGTAPTITSTASKLDKYIFTSDGTNWYGSDAGKSYTV